MELARACAALSNCQKRITVCILFDKENRPAGYGYNFCNPPIQGCVRVGLNQTKEGYTGQEWETVHAAIMALRSRHPKRQAVSATLFGHEFYCKECEAALRVEGITELRISSGYGTGTI